MKRTVICLSVALAAAVTTAQQFEGNLWFCDSITGIASARAVLHNTTSNHVYFYGTNQGYIQVVDGATHQKLGPVETGQSIVNAVHCYNGGRVYAHHEDYYRMVVLDDQTDSVLWTSDIYEHQDMAYSPQMNKLYMLNDRDFVIVFDPGPDTVLATVFLPYSADSLAVDSAHNRVFAYNSGGPCHQCVAIDCSTDVVVDSLQAHDSIRIYSLITHPGFSKMYALGQHQWPDPHWIWVFDAISLALVDSIMLPESWDADESQMMLNPSTDHLYVAFMTGIDAVRTDGGDTILVIDCALDSVVSRAVLPPGEEPTCLTLDPGEDKLYVGLFATDSIAVIHGTAPEVGWVETDDEVFTLGSNLAGDEVYALDCDGVVLCIDCPSDSVVARLDYRFSWPFVLTWNPGGNRLYGLGWAGVGRLGPGDTVATMSSYIEGTPVLVPSWELNRLYASTFRDGFWVYDCNADSFTRHVPLVPGAEPTGGLLLSEFHKLYLALPGSTAVYDIYADSLLGWGHGFGEQLCYNPASGLAYGWSGNSLAAIDPAADTVVASLALLEAEDLVVSPARNEVYVAAGADPYNLHIVDGETHRLVGNVELDHRVRALAWVPDLGKLYAIDDSAVSWVDVVNRRVGVRVPVDAHAIYRPPVLYNRRNQKLYFGGRDRLCVLDCRHDSIVYEYELPEDPYALAWNSIDNRVYAGIVHDQRIWVFRDDLTGVAEDVEVGMPGARTPTVVRDVLRYEPAVVGSQPAAGLHDISGRKVMDLHPGENDVSRLPTGVYFVRTEDGREQQGVHKVVVQR